MLCFTHRGFHHFLAVFHAAQACAVLVMSRTIGSEKYLPVTTAFRTEPPGVEQEITLQVYNEYAISWGIFVFLLLAAMDHYTAYKCWDNYLWIEKDPFRIIRLPGYGQHVTDGFVPQRWIEYAASATIMMLIISMLSGISGYDTLLHIAVAYITVMICGYQTEKLHANQESATSSAYHVGVWYWVGCFLAIPPWIVIFINLAGGDPPGFVYAIVFTLLVCYSAFALVPLLRFGCSVYQPVNRNNAWVDLAYCNLSLVAKTSLAWLIFANVLVD